MKIIERNIDGVFEFNLTPAIDGRGFFMRTYDINFFKEYGIEKKWVQENHSYSKKKGVVRGLHFQLPPFAESKLVYVVRGAILDLFVDLRKGSETFGSLDCIELSEKNKKMVYIPRGFAHGFCTLTNHCDVLYKVDNYYNQEAEGGINWHDETLAIEWPIDNSIVSEKDNCLPSYNDFVEKYGSIDLNKKYL